MTRTLLLAGLVAAACPARAQSAQDSLEARLARAPADAQAHRELSDLLTAQGQPAAAVPHLAWLAERAPADVALRRRLAQTLLWSDQPARAAEVLAEVVALDPADVDARVQVAEIVTWDGGADRAVALLAPVADGHPGDARLHRALAFALVAADDSRARAQLGRALALAPRDAELLIEGGALERWQGDWSLAQERLDRALGQSLTDAQRDRVDVLRAGIRDVSAPTLTAAAARLQDSNGITRTDSPGRLTVPVNGRWTVGAEVLRGAIQSDATATATGTAFVPFVVYRPQRAVQLEAALGAEGTPGAPLALHARASVQRVWTARGFALARLTAATATATDAAEALDRGLARSTLTAEGYAEPSTALTLSGQLGALAYSDGNQRVQAALVARWLPLALGRRAPLPAVSAGVTGGVLYEDSATIYPDARPYYTPDGLLTVSGGLALRLAPGPGLRLDAALGLARQRAGAASAGATAVEYSAAAEYDRGPHAVRLETRRSGSSAYSSQMVGLTTRFRLP